MTDTHVRTKDKILQILGSHGRPVYDILELRELWGPFAPRPRELTRVLWDLQKQGEVKFKERKHGRDSVLSDIRLSRGIDTTVFRANESRGRHPVGKDLTDPQHHHWIAKGGPIERIRLPREETPMVATYTAHGPKPKDNSKWLDYVDKINPNRVRPILPLIAAGIDRPISIQKKLGYSSARITSLVSRGEKLGWVTKEKLDNGVRVSLTEEGARLASELFIDDGKGRGPSPRRKTDTPTQYPAEIITPPTTPAETLIPDAIPTEMIADAMGLPVEPPAIKFPRIIDVVELEKYPIISDLMTKEARIAAYEQAAALLEGFDQDLALSLLEKIQLTPLETEVIAFLRSLR